MTLYVVDTTLTPTKDVTFNSYPQLVSYLDGMSQRAYGSNRKQRMIMLEEIGHGYDDPDGVTFVRSMAEAFNIGVVREGRKMRCDVPSMALYQKEEFGN